MIWLTKSDLEIEGPPSRKDLFWALAATPIFILQIVSVIRRIMRSFDSEPLRLTRYINLEVLASEPTVDFAAAVALYSMILIFSSFLLWGCGLQLQRWFFWRTRT